MDTKVIILCDKEIMFPCTWFEVYVWGIWEYVEIELSAEEAIHSMI